MVTKKSSHFTRDTASFAERHTHWWVGVTKWCVSLWAGQLSADNLYSNNQRYHIYQLHDYSNYITWYLLYTWNANLSDMHTELFTINKYNAIQLYKSWGIHVNYCHTNNLKLQHTSHTCALEYITDSALKASEMLNTLWLVTLPYVLSHGHSAQYCTAIDVGLWETHWGTIICVRTKHCDNILVWTVGTNVLCQLDMSQKTL